MHRVLVGWVQAAINFSFARSLASGKVCKPALIRLLSPLSLMTSIADESLQFFE